MIHSQFDRGGVYHQHMLSRIHWENQFKGPFMSLDAGLSKHQISNLFNSQGALHTANISPLTAIEKCNGVYNGKIH